MAHTVQALAMLPALLSSSAPGDVLRLALMDNENILTTTTRLSNLLFVSPRNTGQHRCNGRNAMKCGYQSIQFRLLLSATESYIFCLFCQVLGRTAAVFYCRINGIKCIKMSELATGLCCRRRLTYKKLPRRHLLPSFR